MVDQQDDPFRLQREVTTRLTLTLTESTHLALYHFCLSRDADAAKMPRAAARIVSSFLARDAALRRWCAAQGRALPTCVPSRATKRGARRA